MTNVFHDRLAERAFFQAELPRDRAALVILYGRRRTGKTSLLRKVAEERNSLFFVADVATRADQLRAFSQIVFEHFDEPDLAETVFPSWEAALRFVANRTSSPSLLVIDEFPYLCQSDPSLPSVLQRLWDAEFRETKLHIVLCGSYVSFMEKEILAAKNPLFGRRTATWLLEPLSFFDDGGLFYLVQQSRIFNGQSSVISQGSSQADLFFYKFSRLRIVKGQLPVHLLFHHYRHADHGPVPVGCLP